MSDAHLRPRSCRRRGEYLGSVEAPDREKAEAIPIKQFALDDDQRRRLLIPVAGLKRAAARGS
jgi:hypothetical protein